jgi:uncharacterized protein YoaH (UPF0181 family)
MLLDDPKISNIHSQPRKKLKAIELMCPGISSGTADLSVALHERRGGAL